MADIMAMGICLADLMLIMCMVDVMLNVADGIPLW